MPLGAVRLPGARRRREPLECSAMASSKEAERDAGDPDTITHEQRIAVYHVNSAYVG